MNTVTVCTATAAAMERKGIPFRPPVDVDAAALDYVKTLGHQRVPVTVVTGEDGNVVEHWAGFRPDKLLALSRTLTG